MRITTPAIKEFDHRPHPAVAVAMRSRGVPLVEHSTGGRGLWIIHTGGRTFLAANMFRSRREFDAMARAVMKAAGHGDDAPDEVE